MSDLYWITAPLYVGHQGSHDLLERIVQERFSGIRNVVLSSGLDGTTRLEVWSEHQDWLSAPFSPAVPGRIANARDLRIASGDMDAHPVQIQLRHREGSEWSGSVRVVLPSGYEHKPSIDCTCLRYDVESLRWANALGALELTAGPWKTSTARAGGVCYKTLEANVVAVQPH